MNALNMIQASLDTLREARPDYTPRIGHIWPIFDPPSISKREKVTTRPGSVMPEGTRAEGCSPTSPPEMKLPKQGESEAAQPWEPFYNAFTFTMNEVLRKRPQRTVPAAVPKLAVPISEVESHTQPDHLTGKRPSLAKSGGKTSVTRLAEKAAALGAGTSAHGDKPGVPTVDVPHRKKKGQPGPPGQPGAGKKKMRRTRSLTLLSLPWLIILPRNCRSGGEEGGVSSRRIFPISFIIKCLPVCQYRVINNMIQPFEAVSLILLLLLDCRVEMPQVEGTEEREITQLQLAENT